ncbi:hypothetical protein Taro_023933 [Colocasia esculenta]|uniref:Uncharacterized protein n=1 Tax=Colocasia esculenta TaxID=4460 RepID=A0A843V7V3_COLES|nr:hypothetical protein [Colocasia esculenta]
MKNSGRSLKDPFSPRFLLLLASPPGPATSWHKLGPTMRVLEKRERGPRKGDSVLVRADWRLLNQGDSTSFGIRSTSKQENLHRWLIEAFGVGEKNCLTDEADFFGLKIVTPIAGRLYLVNGGNNCRLLHVIIVLFLNFIICKWRYVPPSVCVNGAMCRRLFRLNDKTITMATRGRRGVGPSRGDESAGGSQAPAQQSQDQTGVPLPPPPPPVHYGALMQGLVHAMQTQAQTIAALQEAGFAELSKYAPHIVADERRKVKKFIMGLKPSLRTRLVALGHRTMEEALSAACMQEAEMEVYLEEKRASLKRPASAFQH